MNDWPVVSSAGASRRRAPIRGTLRTDDEEVDRGDEVARDDDEAEGDKYDVSTLACTD
jgi:hypothetical protein